MPGQSCQKISAFLLSLCAATNLLAEDTQLEQILVTASRIPTPTYQIGSAYTLLGSDYLERRQSVSLADILRDVPGLAVSRSGVFGATTSVRMRGAESNQVLVLIDGIEANDPAAADMFDFAHLGSDNIDRVEVIRGPQSALWGSDALAGVINVITKRGTGSASVSAFAEGGSFGGRHGGATISGSTKNYQYHISAAVIDANGENISRQGDEDDGYKNQTVSFALGYEPLPELSFLATGRRTDASSEFDGSAAGIPTDADQLTDVLQHYGKVQARLALFEDTWQHQFGATITSTKNDNFTEGVETSATQGEKYKIDYQSSLLFDTDELLAAAHSVVLAIEYEKENFTQRGQATGLGDPNQKQNMSVIAYAGEYRITLLEKISVSASVRYEDNSDFKNAATQRLTAGLCPEANRYPFPCQLWDGKQEANVY